MRNLPTFLKEKQKRKRRKKKERKENNIIPSFLNPNKYVYVTHIQENTTENSVSPTDSYLFFSEIWSKIVLEKKKEKIWSQTLKSQSSIVNRRSSIVRPTFRYSEIATVNQIQLKTREDDRCGSRYQEKCCVPRSSPFRPIRELPQNFTSFFSQVASVQLSCLSSFLEGKQNGIKQTF